MRNDFKVAILNLNTNEDLHRFTNLNFNLFFEIKACDFFHSFLGCHNSRKNDVHDFFNERYKSNDLRKIDEGFISDIIPILEGYLNNEEVSPSPSKKHCELLLNDLKSALECKTN